MRFWRDAALAARALPSQSRRRTSPIRAMKDVLCQAVVGICGHVSERAILSVAAWSTGRGADGSGMVTVACRWKALWRFGSYQVWVCQHFQMMRLSDRPRVLRALRWLWPRARALA